MTQAEREARKAFRQVDAEKAITEHEIAQKVFSANRERLKAERLAREAAGTQLATKKAERAQEEGLIAPRIRTLVDGPITARPRGPSSARWSN